jgi:aspartate aminotransferase
MSTQDHHVVDSIAFGGIVTVRDRLIEQQQAGKKVYRLESGDPSFDVPPHVADAIARALRDGHTHYTAGAGIKPLRDAIHQKLVTENRIPLDGPGSTLVTNGAMHGLCACRATRSSCPIRRGPRRPTT